MSRPGTRLDSKKVNSELFTLTYGALVSQLMKDYENVEDINKQLERMGYNIGIRLIEDFLAKTGSGRCYDFRDTAEKIQNSELFTLTYGALVSQLMKDYENVEDINKQLERMGYNIGIRLIEDFLAKTGSGRCYDFRDTAEKIQAGFRLYLGITPTLANWSASGDEFSLQFEANPLTEFVELPDHCLNLKYCNILTGVLRGALEMVQMDVSSTFVQDHLKGDSCTELRVKFIKRLEDAIPAGED